MKNKRSKKIIVVAGSMSQFKHWLSNVIPVVCKEDINKIRGIEFEEVYYEGNYYEWLTAQCRDQLDILTQRRI